MLLSPGAVAAAVAAAAADAALAPSSIRHLHYYDEMQISLKDTSAERAPTVRMLPVGPFAILQYVCHMPQSGVGVSIYACACMRLPWLVCVCVSVCYSYANYISCV